MVLWYMKENKKGNDSMKFDINKYPGKYVMHCKTKEEARAFCQYLDNVGRKWLSGERYKNKEYWNVYREKTCYSFNNDCYTGIDYYKKENYTIREWSDFMKETFTKADLKTGDVVLKRNGEVEIINRELGMLICKSGWNDLKDVREDLTSILNDRYDIIAVRRPEDKGDCNFEVFEHKWGKLVYERKKVEEMTLEQVCKLLGKEIKIIK